MRQPKVNQNSQSNRAEDIRRRREQRSQQRTSTVTSRAVKPTRAKPVTVRGNAFGSPIHKSAGTRNSRRQFYVAMDHVGAELRLPAIPVLRPGWRVLSVMIAIAAIAGIYSMFASPFLQIYKIDVVGLERLSTDEISKVANLQNLSIVEIDPRSVETAIVAAFPELVEVKLSIEMPNFVTVNVVERQPVAVWYKGENANWLDPDGIVFPMRGEVEGLLIIESDDDLPMAPLPISELAKEIGAQNTSRPVQDFGFLGGLFLSEKDDAEEKQAAALDQVDPVFLTTAQELRQKLSPGALLIYDSYNGLGWYDDQGWQVYIGRDVDTFEAKYAMYEGIARNLNERGLRPALISVEHLNAPFYRMEQ
jgi:cell division protein FtsQ